jgi:metal-responsive CopG/Arc/MetJ family transcriptional regulator
MPGRGYPKVTVRIHPALMAKLNEAADAAGVDRAALVRALIRWYLREPGAVLPKRPRNAEPDFTPDE